MAAEDKKAKKVKVQCIVPDIIKEIVSTNEGESMITRQYAKGKLLGKV